ncbi:MAG TPA: Ig-like domain-containing protein [Streptosporangiaceae bacterium]|nr:Ig-like domain-containing protein [Streptosporangiaceae bacterium]
MAATKPAGPKVTISPANGTAAAKPDQGVTVTAAGGKLTSVKVRAGGHRVAGKMNAASTSWHSRWALGVSTTYHVTATAAAPGGKPVTTTSSFKTLTPSRTFRTMIFEGYGKTYGVGMPIMLTFSEPITNKAAVERALQVSSSKPVVGAWHWVNDQTLNFRPRQYWPAHTTVSFTGHLDGVQGAPGMYGYHTLTQSFNIGRSLIVVASTATHHLNLYRDGKFYQRWPISTGKPGDNTPNGTYLTIDKGNPVLMKGPGYRLKVPWSVRFTWSGDYLHDAYWSVGQQGFANVSHGCVNLSPAHAEAYYKMEMPGSPVTITGSPRAGVPGNGWTDWFMSWQRYLGGSALGKAVQAGPDGSKFVSPSEVSAPHGSAPLHEPVKGNRSAA